MFPILTHNYISKDIVSVVFPINAHTFKMSVTFPNRVYYYIEGWNRDFHDLPNGTWTIQRQSGSMVIFQKIK